MAADTYDVGAGQTYADLQALLTDPGALKSGDTIIIHSDDSSVINAKLGTASMALTIRSADGTPKTITQSGAASHRGGFLSFTNADPASTIDLNISDLIITGNTAQGTNTWTSTGQGGAVATFASLNILGSNVKFTDNTAIGGLGTQSAGQGGAIWAYNILSLAGSGDIEFSGNKAIGTDRNNSGQGGAIYAPTVDLSNARNVTFSGNQAIGGGNNASVHTSGLGGAIGVSNMDLIMDGARNVVFSSNSAMGGAVSSRQSVYNSGLGGAIFLNYSPIMDSRTITGASFLNNTATTDMDGDMSSGRGGAVFNSGPGLNLKAEVGGDVLFSGNTHNPGKTGAVPNSIYFGNIYTSSNLVTDFTVDVDAGALVTMLDPMASQEDDLVGYESHTMKNLDLSISKSGAGTWILGGYNDMRSATTWNVNEGVLRLEIVNGQTAHLDLSHEDTAVFNLNAGTKLLVNPTTSAHFIQANDITIQGASGIWDGGAFSYQNLPGDGQNAYLSLRANDSLTNDMIILNPDGSFISGFFEYSYYGLEWRVNNALSHDLVAWITTKSYVPELGGSGATTGPSAIISRNLLGRTLGLRWAENFDCFDDCAAGLYEPAARPGGNRRQCDNDQGRDGNVWFRALYDYTSHNGPGDFLIRTPGFAVGIDNCFNERFFLGLALLGAKPEYRSNKTKIDADALEVAVYGGGLLPGRIELGAMASIGRGWYDQRRTVRDEVHHKKYQSDDWSLGAELSRRFQLNDAWTMRPFASYRYQRMEVDRYRENSGVYALDFEGHTEEFHFIRAGLDTTWTDNDKSLITGSLYYTGLGGDTSPKVGASFVQDQNNTRYLSLGDELDKNAVGVGLSGFYNLGDKVDLTASYQFEAGKRSRSHHGAIGLNIGF